MIKEEPLKDQAIQRLSELVDEITKNTRFVDGDVVLGHPVDRDEGGRPFAEALYGFEETDRRRLELENKAADILIKKLPWTFQQGLSPEAFVLAELIRRIDSAYRGSEAGLAPDLLDPPTIARVKQDFLSASRSLPRNYHFDFRMAAVGRPCDMPPMPPVDLGNGIELLFASGLKAPHEEQHLVRKKWSFMFLSGQVYSYFPEKDWPLWEWRWGSRHYLAPVLGLLSAVDLLTTPGGTDLDPIVGFTDQPRDLAVLTIDNSDRSSGQTTGRFDEITRLATQLWTSNNLFSLPAQQFDFASGGKELSPRDIALTQLSILEGLFSDDPQRVRIRSSASWLVKMLASHDPAEQVVFLMTAFEALLGEQAPQEDIGLQRMLSERLSYLLGSSREQREEIRRQFKNAYDLRSRVLHRGWLDFSPTKGPAGKGEKAPRVQYEEVLTEVIPLLKRAIAKEALAFQPVT